VVVEGALSPAGKRVEGARLHHDAFRDVGLRGVQRGHGVGVADLERDDAHRARVAVPLHLGGRGRGDVGWSERESGGGPEIHRTHLRARRQRRVRLVRKEGRDVSS